MKVKKILIISMAFMLLLSVLAVAYAYFASTISNNDPQRFTVETGNLELTFNNGNGNLTGVIGVNQTLEKTFSITNKGTYDEYAKLSWLDLTNTYTNGSLVYVLEESDDNLVFTEVARGNVPTTASNESKTVDLKDGLLVPTDADASSATYKNRVKYYRLSITLVDLGASVDQTSDYNASLYTRFTISKGTEPSTQICSSVGSQLQFLDESGNVESCIDSLEVGQRIAIGDQVFRYIRTTDTNNNLSECGEETGTGTPCADSSTGKLRLIAEYNLMVGNYCSESNNCVEMTQVDLSAGTYGDDVKNETIGLQSSYAIGHPGTNIYPRYGITPFSSPSQKGTNHSTYTGSIIENYITAYANTLNSTYYNNENVIIGDAITQAELENVFNCSAGTCSTNINGENTSWIYSTSYWTKSPGDNYDVLFVLANNSYGFAATNTSIICGVRPVISIDASLI